MNQPLLTDLENRTRTIISKLEEFNSLPEELLGQKENPETWSVLECIEHLKYYSDYYIPEIRKTLSKATPYRAPFRTGWLGNYFAKMMKPGTKKISTFKSMNPNGKILTREVISEFLAQQQEMCELLARADSADLTANRASVSIAPWLRLRLGDILRVVIYHNERHILQAENVLRRQKEIKLS